MTDLNESVLTVPDSESSEASSPTASEQPSAPSGPTTSESSAETSSACPQCGSTESWGAASWCPECGYYPALGTSLNGSSSVQPVQETNVDHWWEVIPGWAVVLGAGLILIAGISLAASVILPAEGGWRALWTLAQGGLGLVLLGTAHLMAFLYATSNTDRFSPFDFFLKPVDVWKPTLQQLPKSANRVCTMSWGLSAFVLAFALIGGVQFSALFEDWGVRHQPKQNVVQAIVSQAREQQEAGADSLQGAINDFVGDEDADASGADENEQQVDNRPTADCLIVGYTGSDDDFETVLLATAVQGRLKVVGMLSASDIPEDARRRLNRRLSKLGQDRPFVATNQAAHWLRPVLMCRVAYTSWTASKQLRQPEFRELLEDVRID